MIEESGEVAVYNEQPPKQITFYIKYDTFININQYNYMYTCTGEEDMTWAEWCESPYNTYEYYCDDSNYIKIYRDNYPFYMSSSGGVKVGDIKGTDTIIEGCTYYESYICCFVAGTKVTMADGSLKNVEDIIVGEYVKSYNVETGEIYDVYVKGTPKNPFTNELLIVELEDGTVLKMNTYHPLYTRGGWHSYTNHNEYDTLVVGDEVKTYEGWSKIVSLNIEECKTTTYTLNVCDNKHIETEGKNDNFFVNGVVAHNAPCST